MRFPSGQPSWQKGMPQSMQREACDARTASGTGSSNSCQSWSLSSTGLLSCWSRSISRNPRALPMDGRLLSRGLGDVPSRRDVRNRRGQRGQVNAVGRRRLLRFEGAAVLARHDLHELGGDGFPRIEQLERLSAAPSLHVLFEKPAEHLGVGLSDRLELDHLLVAASFEVRILVEYEGEPSAHARAEVAPGGAEHA